MRRQRRRRPAAPPRPCELAGRWPTGREFVAALDLKVAKQKLMAKQLGVAEA